MELRGVAVIFSDRVLRENEVGRGTTTGEGKNIYVHEEEAFSRASILLELRRRCGL